MMTNLFLKAKHWQLFIVMFGIPIIFQIVMISSIFSEIAASQNPNPFIMVKYLQFIPLIMVLYIGTFFGWLWSVGVGLQKKIPASIPMKLIQFRIFLIIPVVYVLFFVFYIMNFFNGIMEGNIIESTQVLATVTALIVPLHLFSIFCIFYTMHFIAKTIKTAELKKVVTFSDFVGEFFLIWFAPIGIWILQPKINQLVNPQPESDDLLDFE